MAKGKYQKWLEPDNLSLIMGWRHNGLTHDDVAAKIGITRSTLYEWADKFPDFSDALKQGAEEADVAVENALFKNALSGNIAAQIFWLKNRKRDKWRDRPELNASDAAAAEPIKVQFTDNGEPDAKH